MPILAGRGCGLVVAFLQVLVKHAGGRRVVAGKDTTRVETWQLELEKEKARSGKPERAKLSDQSLMMRMGGR